MAAFRMEDLLSVSDMQCIRNLLVGHPTCIVNLTLDYLPTFHTYKQFCDTEQLNFTFIHEGPEPVFGLGRYCFWWDLGVAMLRHHDFEYEFKLTRNDLWDFIVTSHALPIIESMRAMPGATEIDPGWGPPARLQRFSDLYTVWARVHIELIRHLQTT